MLARRKCKDSRPHPKVGAERDEACRRFHSALRKRLIRSEQRERRGTEKRRPAEIARVFCAERVKTVRLPMQAPWQGRRCISWNSDVQRP
jgi:hypothetical protein